MNIKNSVVKNMSLAVVSLAIGIAGSLNGRAADPRTPAPAPSRGTAAKVIIVDRAAKAITVDIHGTIHLLWLSADIKVRKDGKDATIADIAPGQTVNVVTKKTARGDVEIVAEISIESSDTESEAAGRVRAAKSNERSKIVGRQSDGGGSDLGRGTPPLFAPPPVTRPIVSPHN
ncbi:MAG: hypothetical protein QOF48_2831 [Verrucomicrobiota bacterium]|jgi:hypothetical protein